MRGLRQATKNQYVLVWMSAGCACGYLDPVAAYNVDAGWNGLMNCQQYNDEATAHVAEQLQPGDMVTIVNVFEHFMADGVSNNITSYTSYLSILHSIVVAKRAFLLLIADWGWFAKNPQLCVPTSMNSFPPARPHAEIIRQIGHAAWHLLLRHLRPAVWH